MIVAVYTAPPLATRRKHAASPSARGRDRTALKDNFDLFGGLFEIIEDDWIEDIERLDDLMDRYLHLRQQARNAFELRYEATVEPEAHRWDLRSRVLSRQDIVTRMSEPW